MVSNTTDLRASYKRSYLFYLFIFLGALSAFPPLVTDMYLPALPAMASYFSASPYALRSRCQRDAR